MSICIHVKNYLFECISGIHNVHLDGPFALTTFGSQSKHKAQNLQFEVEKCRKTAPNTSPMHSNLCSKLEMLGKY